MSLVNNTIIFEKVSKVLLLVLVFLIPLWFLPITQDFLDFQKQAVFLLFVFLTLVVWVIKTLKNKKINIKLSWVYLPVILFVLVSLVSSFFSVWQYVSFWGWPLNVSDSFISVLFFALLFFLIVNIIESEKEAVWLIISFISSFAIAVLYSILQSYQIFAIPFPFFELSTFNTIGSMNSIAVLSAVFFPLSLMLAFSLKGILKWILFLISIIFFLGVLLVNFFYAWISLALGLVILIFLGVLHLKEKSTFQWIYFPIVLLILSLVFLIFRFSIPGLPKIIQEQSPSGSTQMHIFYGSVKQNAVFGTGPATFSLDYSKYHGAWLNKSVFWGATFSSGASEIMDKFITTGIAGGILVLAIFLTAILFSIREILKSKGDDIYSFLKFGLVASLVAMFSAQMFYYANFVISFAFWILLALVSFIFSKKQKKIALPKESKQFVGWFSFFLIVFIFGIGFIFIAGQKYAAEISYFNGLKEISRGNQDNGISKMISATKLNPSVDLYWRDLAQFYISSVININSDSNLSDSDKKSKSQSTISNAVFSANQSIKAGPANVENWNMRGYVYRNLIGIENAAELAIESYSKSVELQPASPFAWTELARVYFLKAQYLASQKSDINSQNDALNKSLESSNKAIELDSDYAPAYYLVALVYDQQGNSDEVIKKLEETQKAAPNDVSLAFQIGMIYYQKNQIDKASIQFERARDLDNNYSNARYMLGLVYEKQGSIDKAMNEFEKLKELNPNDSEIQTILDNLKAGKPSYGQLTK